VTYASFAHAQAKPKSIAEELSGEARAEFEQGKELFEHDDFVTAHAKLERAYELSQNPRILWNLAACSAKQKKYALAIAEADRYLLEGTGKLTPEQTDRAQQFIAGLRGLVAEATFSVTPAGGKLSIDRTPRGLLTVPTVVLLDLGTHTVQIEKEGYEDTRTSIDVTRVGKQFYAFKLPELVKTGRVAISTDMDAIIEVDGKPVAKGVYEGAFPVGAHRVRISAPNRETHEALVEVTDGTTKQLAVTLQAKKDESSAWWPWAVGGAAVAVGAGVGGYFLFKPTDKVGQPIDGSIGTIRIN
jgi:hypothetical protein